MKANVANKKFFSLVRKSSVSKEDAENRIKVYSEVMKNNENIRTAMKNFSGFAEMPMLTNQYFNATVTANIRSFAGFICIERDMNQPTALLGYYDLLGVTDNRVVQPNTKYGNVSGLGTPVTKDGALAAGLASVNMGAKIIPGSVEIIGEDGSGAEYVIRDDAKGNLIAAAGLLQSGTVDYVNGLIDWQMTNGALSTAFVAKAANDIAGDPTFASAPITDVNRFKLERKHVIAHALPQLLVGETDLMTLAGSEKGLGENIVSIMGAKLSEVYQRVINKNIIDVLVAGDTSTAYTINMTAAQSQFMDYQSRLDYFEAELIAVETELAKQSAVGVVATAYVVATDVANWFRRLKAKGSFKENTDSTFIDDLVGYYNDVPVLRHKELPLGTGYAVHKTHDGQLAPVIRGIFLPLTQTPMVGNYLNPTQQAQGLYYQEAFESIAPELCQKFIVA